MPNSRLEQRWFLPLLTLTATALFLLLHPYRGLVHDAQLYTLQALSHLRPELYSGDIFLRLGSQDDFTVFSSLYAWIISLIGVEPAAAITTLCSILLFLIAIFMFGRALLSTQEAWIPLFLIMLIPGHYGAQHVFHLIEEFVAPRQLAEALTIFSLLAWLKEKRLLGVLLATGAMLVHPIMGLSGVVFLITFEWVLPHWRKLWPLAAVAALGTTIFGVFDWLPIERWQFDAEWYEIVMSRLYLSLHNWDAETWGRVLTVFVTLAIASMILENRLRRISVAAIVACGSLVLLALVGGDLLRIVIVVQAQPWRAMWLATALAILLLPPIYLRGWRDTPLLRCALLLLAAAWAAPHAVLALSCAMFALVAALVARRESTEQYARALVLGSWMALMISLFFTLADAQLSLNSDLNRMGALPPMVDRVLTYSLSGVLPALVLLAGGYIALRFRSRAAVVTLTVIAAVGVALIVVPAGRTWIDVTHIEEDRAAFAEWRALIPTGSEVLWTGETSERESGALNTWLLLERPSFISRTQASNALFSRPAAIEMRDRSQSLHGLLPFLDPFRSDAPAPLEHPLLLEPVCRNTTVRYIVIKETLADAVPTPAPTSASSFLRDYKLYSCT